MSLRYFKPDILIGTCCEHCGTQRLETLARLYSDDKLMRAACGQEHTAQRAAFRATVEETEAAVMRLPAWTDQLVAWLRRH